MKAFSVVFRDVLTDKLYSGVMNQRELTALVNNSAVKICCCTEIWRG